MSVIKKSFIKIATLMLGVTLVATACDFGKTTSTSETSQSSSSEVSTQTSITSSDISSSTTTSNSQSSVSSSSTSSSIIPTLTGISLNTDNVKKEYNYGETLNLAGLVVTASYSDNTTTQVANYTTNIANGSELKTVGENDVVVTYESFTASFKITVSKVLTGIELNTENVKKAYGYNEALDLTGLVVTAKYNDNSTAVVTDYTTDPANGTVLTSIGEFTVTVTYQGKTATFGYEVSKVLTGIRVDATNVKKDYFYGDTLDLTGMNVFGLYNDRTEATVFDYTVDPANGSELKTVGENTVTVTYQGKTDSFKINVARKEVAMDICYTTVKDEYVEGEALDLSGLEIRIYFNDGTREEITTGYTTDPANGTILNTVGQQKITVTYKSVSNYFFVTVKEALVAETGTELLLDLSVAPEFEGNVANVAARGTTPKSDYFVNFKLTSNSSSTESMTMVNSKLRVMQDDVIENTESLHGVTAITVNGGNGNFRLYAGYTATEMYEFLEAESNGGDRIFENIPNVNYIKLVGKYDTHPADILSIEFTYTRDVENKPVDGAITPINTLTVNEGCYIKGGKTLYIDGDTANVDAKTYTYTGIVYKDALLYTNEYGAGLLIKFVNDTAVIVTDTLDHYSSLTGQYTKVIAATEIKLFIDGDETPFNSSTERQEMEVGETLRVSATCNAVPTEDVQISLVDESMTGEVDEYAGTYTAKGPLYLYDAMGNGESTVTIDPIIVTNVDGNYYMEYSDSSEGFYPGFTGKVEAFISKGVIVAYATDELTIKIIPESKTIELGYYDLESYSFWAEGSVGYTYESTSKPTASFENGVVKALNAGNFYLEFKTNNGLDEKYYLFVNDYVAARITVDATPVSLKVGETHQINATVNEDATDKTLLFDTSDKTVLTVSETGLVTAVKEGTAKVIISSNDEDVEIEFTVTKGANTITVTTYSFEDENGDKHTLVVKEGVSACLDDTYNFTFDSGLYVYDEKDDIIIEVSVSGSQAYLDFTDGEMGIFGYYGPVYSYSGNTIYLTFVSSEQVEQGQGQGGEGGQGGEQGQGGQQQTTVAYTFMDDGGVEHTLAVIEEKEATIDDTFHFTYSNGHYYFDDDDTCYFDIRHSGADLFDYYGENMAYYLNGIAEFYADEGTADLTKVG